MIALNSPLKPCPQKLQRYLEQINRNGWFTNFGPLEQELTAKLSEYLGVKNLLLVNNGTSALQVAAQALGVENIITTPFTFVATASAFMWQKKKISFADINVNSFNLSCESVANSLKKDTLIDGVVATHVYGNPCNVDAYSNLQNSNKVKVIYDAAHAFGVDVNNQSILNYGDASILSFHATKLFHTAEGGAIAFKNEEDYIKAKLLINFGFKNGDNTEVVGINAKLNEYQAAIGLVNLDNIDEVIEHRVSLFELYLKELNGVVQFPLWHGNANYNGAYMPIYIDNLNDFSNLVRALSAENIGYRKYFKAIDTLYSHNSSESLINSHRISQGILCLPLHAYMSVHDVLKVSHVIRSTLKNN